MYEDPFADTVPSTPDVDFNPSPPSEYDPSNPPSEFVPSAPDFAPVPIGQPLQNKVVYGRRLNSYTPCLGNTAFSRDSCSQMCTQLAGCRAWTFTDNFNCGWIGESNPTGLCYLMADTDESSIFDAPAGDYFVSGFI